MVRFSHRTTWPGQQNPLTAEVVSRRERGEPLIDLTLSNPTSAGFRYPEALLSALSTSASLRYRPESLGLPEARDELARWYRDRGAGVASERTVLTASSSESYSYLFHLLADPGDEVLVPAPSYPLLSFLADLAGVTLRSYPLRYDGAWHVDLDALRSRLTARTRAIVVISPNNPTGSYLKPDEATALRALASERGLALISDEVFAEYPFGAPRGRSLAGDDSCLTFVLGGLSKLAGLPQLKLGWIFVAGPAPHVEAALSRLELIADTFLSVSTPVQQALPTLLRAADVVGDQIRDRTRRNLDALRSGLRDAPATLLDVEGGWSAVVQLPATRTEEEWALALLRQGVLVHPGHFFDFDREPFAVLSLLPRPDDFDAGLAALGLALEG